MPVPDYQSLMLPLLEGLTDGREHLLADLREEIARRLGLTEADRELMLPSGKQAVYDNRLGWAKTYLGKAGLVHSVRRGVYQLTERGLAVIAKRPARVDVAFLAQFPEFEEFRRRPEEPTGAASSNLAAPYPAGLPKTVPLPKSHSTLRTCASVRDCSRRCWLPCEWLRFVSSNGWS